MARRFAKKIDELNWHGVVGVGAFAAGTFAVNLISASLGSFTIMRSRGEFTGSIDGTETPNAKAQITMGVWIVPEGTGTTVLASPVSDPNADWFIYETVVLGYEEMVTDVIGVQALMGFRNVIDSKAMRKMRSDTEVQVVFENNTLANGLSATVSFVGRILLGN